MNSLLQFGLEILGVVGKQTFADLSPYLLVQLEVLFKLGLLSVEIALHPEPPAEKKILWNGQLGTLRTIETSAKEKGTDMLADIPGILLSATAKEFTGLF